jgi:hypothetical protein
MDYLVFRDQMDPDRFSLPGLVEITDDGLRLDLFWSEVVADGVGAPTGMEFIVGFVYA